MPGTIVNLTQSIGIAVCKYEFKDGVNTETVTNKPNGTLVVD